LHGVDSDALCDRLCPLDVVEMHDAQALANRIEEIVVV